MCINGSRVFQMPPVIHFGNHSAAQAGPEAGRLGAKKVLLITDEVLMRAGTVKPVLDSLAADGIEAVVFDQITSEPDLEIPSLETLGVEKKKLDKIVAQMAKDAIASGSPGNNPRIATAEEIASLYYAAF